MKKLLTALLFALFAFAGQAQDYCNFSNCLFWQPETNTVLGDTVNYATNQWSIDEWDNIDCNFPTTQCENLGLEVYYPSTLQPNEKRPLLMLIHGGGFVGGSRTDFTQQAKEIATLGYVTATIDYRLCKRNNCLLLAQNAAFACGLNWGADMLQSAYVAAHDGNAALSFLKQNANAYHIDTNNIIIGGVSAGAITAVLMAYTDQVEANSLGGTNNFQSLWGNIGYHTGIKGVICLAGAAIDTTFIDANENIPTYIVHGTCDPVVCYGADAVYHCNSSYPDVYGGADIALRLANLNHNYYLFTGQDMGHNVISLAGAWYRDMLYFLRKNVLCGEAIQKHVVQNLNPDSEECVVLESNLPGSHTRFVPSILPQSTAYGNFPAPCTVGVDEELAETIQVYPNPAEDVVWITMPNMSEKLQLQISTLQGQQVYSGSIVAGTQSIAINNLQNGIYLLAINTGTKTLLNHRLVICR